MNNESSSILNVLNDVTSSEQFVLGEFCIDGPVIFNKHGLIKVFRETERDKLNSSIGDSNAFYNSLLDHSQNGLLPWWGTDINMLSFSEDQSKLFEKFRVQVHETAHAVNLLTSPLGLLLFHLSELQYSSVYTFFALAEKVIGSRQVDIQYPLILWHIQGTAPVFLRGLLDELTTAFLAHEALKLAFLGGGNYTAFEAAQLFNKFINVLNQVTNIPAEVSSVSTGILEQTKKLHEYAATPPVLGTSGKDYPPLGATVIMEGLARACEWKFLTMGYLNEEDRLMAFNRGQGIRYILALNFTNQILELSGQRALDNHIFACELALMSAIDPFSLHLWSGRSPSWLDIHPGYRFITILKVMKHEGILITDLKEEYTLKSKLICEKLNWPSPTEICLSLAEPQYSFDYMNEHEAFFELHRRMSALKTKHPHIDMLPSQEDFSDDWIDIPVVCTPTRCIINDHRGFMNFLILKSAREVAKPPRHSYIDQVFSTLRKENPGSHLESKVALMQKFVRHNGVLVGPIK